MSDNNTDIEHLKQQLAVIQGDTVSILDTTVTTGPSVTRVTQSVPLHGRQVPTGDRKGRAPPVDSFNGEDKTVKPDDWVMVL